MNLCLSSTGQIDEEMMKMRNPSTMFDQLWWRAGYSEQSFCFPPKSSEIQNCQKFLTLSPEDWGRGPRFHRSFPLKWICFPPKRRQNRSQCTGKKHSSAKKPKHWMRDSVWGKSSPDIIEISEIEFLTLIVVLKATVFTILALFINQPCEPWPDITGWCFYSWLDIIA